MRPDEPQEGVRVGGSQKLKLRKGLCVAHVLSYPLSVTLFRGREWVVFIALSLIGIAWGLAGGGPDPQDFPRQ
jgi:hypothetical protein